MTARGSARYRRHHACAAHKQTTPTTRKHERAHRNANFRTAAEQRCRTFIAARSGAIPRGKKANTSSGSLLTTGIYTFTIIYFPRCSQSLHLVVVDRYDLKLLNELRISLLPFVAAAVCLRNGYDNKLKLVAGLQLVARRGVTSQKRSCSLVIVANVSMCVPHCLSLPRLSYER